MKILKKVNTPDPNLNQVQENVDRVLGNINENPILNGKIIDNIALTQDEPFELNHGLERKIKGYMIIKKSGEADVYDRLSNLPTKTHILTSSANVVISVYIF